MFEEIIIIVKNNEFYQIVFIQDCIILHVEHYEREHHSQYLNLDITKFRFLQ
jgi:hypothetical protein